MWLNEELENILFRVDDYDIILEIEEAICGDDFFYKEYIINKYKFRILL